jgi:ribosomal protein S2
MKYPIPANDTSVRAIRLVAAEIADAYVAGKRPASAK